MKLLCVCMAVCAVMMCSGAQSACVTLDTQQMQVTGIVAPILFYGPSNYGEDPARDAKEIAAVLKLDHPLSVCPGASVDHTISDSPVGEMQMILRDPPYGRQWNGRHVLASGTLFAAQTGHHHTPVMFDVRDIHPMSAR